VGHQPQIHGGGVARYILTQGNSQPGLDATEGRRVEHAAQRNERGGAVGHLDANHGPARDRRFDADRRRGQGQGQVVHQAGYASHTHPLTLDLPLRSCPLDIAGIDAELGDGWPLADLDDLGRHSKAGQGLFNDLHLAPHIGVAVGMG
jgi:hypothetical protein